MPKGSRVFVYSCMSSNHAGNSLDLSQTAFRYSDRRGLDQLGFLDKPRWQKMLFLRNFEQIWVEVKMFCCRCPIVVVTCLS